MPRSGSAKSRTKCFNTAVCFFGITRSLRHTIDSIEKNVIAAAKSIGNVDVHAHFFIQDRIDNPRSGENLSVDQDEYKLLQYDSLVLDEQDPPALRCILANAETLGDWWCDGGVSTRNLMRQLYSLNTVADATSKNKYDLVVFCRPDLEYHDSLSGVLAKAARSKRPTVFIPHWQSCGGLNDRFAVVAGERAVAAYGRRFLRVLEYCHTQGTAIQSERFLLECLRDIDVKPMSVRASRVRATGIRVNENFLHSSTDRIIQLSKSLPGPLRAIVREFAWIQQKARFGDSTQGIRK